MLVVVQLLQRRLGDGDRAVSRRLGNGVSDRPVNERCIAKSETSGGRAVVVQVRLLAVQRRLTRAVGKSQQPSRRSAQHLMRQSRSRHGAGTRKRTLRQSKRSGMPQSGSRLGVATAAHVARPVAAQSQSRSSQLRETLSSRPAAKARRVTVGQRPRRGIASSQRRGNGQPVGLLAVQRRLMRAVVQVRVILTGQRRLMRAVVQVRVLVVAALQGLVPSNGTSSCLVQVLG
jgi:hypothetical protein